MSLCGVVSVTGADSQAQPTRPNEVINSSAARMGSIPTKIVIVSPGTDIIAHTGQRLTMHLKFIRSDTEWGILDAVLGAGGSLDGKSLYSIGELLVTGSNGEIGPITVITPDPRPIVRAIQTLALVILLLGLLSCR